MHRVYTYVTVRVICDIEEGTTINDVLTDLDYNFTLQTPGADLVDTEIVDWEVKDSK